MTIEEFRNLYAPANLPACDRGMKFLHEFTKSVEHDDEREAGAWWKAFSTHRSECDDCMER